MRKDEDMLSGGRAKALPTVGHRFPATKSHPQAHLREGDEDSRCPGYK
jgi:hypothetical protein